MKNSKKSKKTSFAEQLRVNLDKNIKLSPLLDGIIDELERIENIRDCLYKAYSEGDLFEEYTNKAGATNLVVNAAIKEYKSYSQRFNDLMKTIHNIIKDVIIPLTPDEPDPFEKILGRGKNV